MLRSVAFEKLSAVCLLCWCRLLILLVISSPLKIKCVLYVVLKIEDQLAGPFQTLIGAANICCQSTVIG